MMDSYSMPARDKDGNWVKTEDFLKICYLEQYTSIFINEGFESFESIREITEDDLIALQVKRGHRRVIQRNIATLNGIPRYHPIMMTNVTNTASMHVADMPNPYSTSGYESLSSMDRKDSLPRSIPIEGPSTPTQSTNIEMAMRSCSFSSDEGDTANESSKRKYRRHPKLDKNAPIKPTSAYIMFSNHVRNEFKEKNISFAELAKIVGDRWKRLDPAEKNKYESIASREKDEYTKTVKEYQKTEEYKNYQSYLTDFKKKQDSINKRITRFRRRAKLERADSESVGDGSSNSRTDVGSSSSGSTDIYQLHQQEHPDDRPVLPSPTRITRFKHSNQPRPSPIPINKIISKEE